MDTSTSAVAELVASAIHAAYNEEPELFLIGSSERSLIFQIGCRLRPLVSADWSIDVEYNRQFDDDGYTKKTLRSLCRNGNLGDRRIYPDLIIHKRGFGEERNLLMLEAKRAAAANFADGRRFDLHKLSLARTQFRYRHTVYVELAERSARWYWPNAEDDPNDDISDRLVEV